MLAPFSRPIPLTPFDLAAALVVREERIGAMTHHQMTFALAARAKLAKLLDDVDEATADAALEWLADALR